MEDAKFIALTLQQINKHTHHVKDLMVSKRANKEKETLEEHLNSINKLVYLICIHESQSALAN